VAKFRAAPTDHHFLSSLFELCSAGLALEAITVYADDLDSSQTAAAAHGSSSKAPQLVGAAAGGSSNSSAVGGFDWQSLWGCDSSSDAALEAPSTGSFLLGNDYDY
jgi:hypothetical protein